MITIEQLKDIKERTEALNRYLDIEGKKIQVEEEEKSETLKEKLYHMWVYLVKIAATMAFCFFFVSIFSILFGNENSIVGVVVLLCLMVFRNADLGIHTGQSTMLLALFFVIMTCYYITSFLVCQELF